MEHGVLALLIRNGALAPLQRLNTELYARVRPRTSEGDWCVFVQVRRPRFPRPRLCRSRPRAIGLSSATNLFEASVWLADPTEERRSLIRSRCRRRRWTEDSALNVNARPRRVKRHERLIVIIARITSVELRSEDRQHGTLTSVVEPSERLVADDRFRRWLGLGRRDWGAWARWLWSYGDGTVEEDV